MESKSVQTRQPVRCRCSRHRTSASGGPRQLNEHNGEDHISVGGRLTNSTKEACLTKTGADALTAVMRRDGDAL
jgi:hypothetical protein